MANPYKSTIQKMFDEKEPIMETMNYCGYWIYWGYKVIIVQAKTRKEAKKKIKKSQYYDGIPFKHSCIYTVKEFAKMCDTK